MLQVLEFVFIALLIVVGVFVLVSHAEQQNRLLRESLAEKFGKETIVGNSKPIQDVLTLACKVAPTSSLDSTLMLSVKSSSVAVRVMARCIKPSGRVIERPSRKPRIPITATPIAAAEIVIARVLENADSASAADP